MKTENKFNTSAVHLNNGNEDCKHPLLQPTLTSKGIRTGLYICIKCNEIIKDTLGTLMVKELSF